MSAGHDAVHAALDEVWLSLDELCRVGAVSPQWVQQRLHDGLLGDAGAPPSTAATTSRFDVVTVRRVQRMVRLERDFDAMPELAALVVDLQDEIERLRARLRRHGVT